MVCVSSLAVGGLDGDDMACSCGRACACVCAVANRGRGRSLDLAGGPRPTVGARLRLIGVHGPHTEDEYIDVLSDLADIAGRPPRAVQLIAVGDWNAEIAQPRGARCSAEAESLVHAARALGLQLQPMPPPASGPGGPHDAACVQHPFTRVPQGAVAAAGRSSAIDFVMASSGVVSSCAIDWRGEPADHAMVVASVNPALSGAPAHGSGGPRRARPGVRIFASPWMTPGRRVQ